MTSATQLLSGMRGRRLCFELVRRAGSTDVGLAMLGAARRVDGRRGDLASGSVFYASSSSPAGLLPPCDPHAAPTLVEALTAALTSFVVLADHLLPALSATVDSTMGWQPPDSEDVVLTDPTIAAALLPVAEAVLATPETRWWATPLDRTAQVRTVFEGTTPAEGSAQPGPEGTTAERLSRWHGAALAEERRRPGERETNPGVAVGGTWWVTPAVVGLELTTRALGTAGSAALWLTEDELGWRSADLVPYAVDDYVCVLEITGPEDWAALVATYPLDVTASRQPDWFGAVDAVEGTWLIPDWPAVAERYDGVHVSVLGWLTTSGVAVPVGPGATTTLAGWGPDATWWLADVVRAEGTGERWVRDHETWRLEQPAHPSGLTPPSVPTGGAASP